MSGRLLLFINTSSDVAMSPEIESLEFHCLVSQGPQCLNSCTRYIDSQARKLGSSHPLSLIKAHLLPMWQIKGDTCLNWWAGAHMPMKT